MQKDDCLECRHLRALAEIRGEPYNPAICTTCIPPGPRPKMMVFYVFCGVLFWAFLLFAFRPLLGILGDIL